jgi:hypothetical protein
MRAFILLSALCIAACADQHPKTAAQPEDVEVEKKRLAEAIKYGYKITTTNGETLYCRSDWATGSHIQKNTVCLTAQQLDDLGQRNDRDYTMPNRSPGSTLP